MSGNEAFVKMVGLLVLGSIATKVITVIAPRVAANSPSRVVTDAAGNLAATGADALVEKVTSLKN